MVLSPLMANSFRANYSTQSANGVTSLDSFGGAVPPSLSVLGPGLPSPGSVDLLFGTFDTGFYSRPDPKQEIAAPSSISPTILPRLTERTDGRSEPTIARSTWTFIPLPYFNIW